MGLKIDLSDEKIKEARFAPCMGLEKIIIDIIK